MAVVDQTLEFLLLVRSRLRHYEYPCEPGHYLPGWIYILIMDACRGQIGNQGFHRRGYFGSARDEATRTAPLTFDPALLFTDADGLPKDMTACATSCADFHFGTSPFTEDRLALDFTFHPFPSNRTTV